MCCDMWVIRRLVKSSGPADLPALQRLYQTAVLCISTFFWQAVGTHLALIWHSFCTYFGTHFGTCFGTHFALIWNFVPTGISSKPPSQQTSQHREELVRVQQEAVASEIKSKEWRNWRAPHWWMFPQCSLNVSSMGPQCFLNVPPRQGVHPRLLLSNPLCCHLDNWPLPGCKSSRVLDALDTHLFCHFLSYFPGACQLQWQAGILVVGEDPVIPRNAKKLPLIPAVKLFLRGYVSIWRYKYTVPPVLSTSPIDYYDGGTVRINTEFYSWDISFGLVNPRLRYSCGQVVFCVNLGTFLKCFLQLGWRLTGVRSTHTECSPKKVHWMFPLSPVRSNPRSGGTGEEPPLVNVPSMLPEWALNVPRIFPECSLNVPWMFPECCLQGGTGRSLQWTQWEGWGG
jgi:hypothetical protein